MSLELVDQMVQQLPYTLRDQVTGYAAAIEECGEDIFHDTEVPFDQALLDRLVFVVGVRRLWTLVDWQFSVLNNSLSMLSRDQADGFAIGRRRLDRRSKEYADLAQIRADLLQKIRDLDCERYVVSRSVKDILRLLSGEAGGHQ
jgi:hypothetical protein